ncbi:hypothetical protein [Ralstonia pseudosolanacearum]|uniref:hypothetical protein n=1 Tax=Ralstonia pseudosolanacearum TaxID=1310165 RepID=UPI0018D1768A|nr:hypothetical protein [Ralstonia pseudosolanacearum]UWD92045.1 hypothetical protein NY025_13770 [Ralstonia pseudosolanacearum]CAH0443518.1 hypothetical protein LMG9673_04046 [Ralstonia pseudosolanacearum]
MSLGAAADVAIGLIFCYLLLGLIGSSVQEAIAGLINLRGKTLFQGLQRMLDGPASPLFTGVAAHALVRSDSADGREPSYVSAANFSLALIDTLLNSPSSNGAPSNTIADLQASIAKLPEGKAKQALGALLTQANGSLSQFQADVEHWFDDAMDRVSGIYKRWAHNSLLIFGIVIAFGGNIDTIAIAQTLWTSAAVRAQVVEAAQQATSGVKGADGLAANAAAKLADLPIPIGWHDKPSDSSATLAILAKIVGCLITALAVSLGAPFWFDTLQKFLNLRTTGPRPKKSDSETESPEGSPFTAESRSLRSASSGNSIARVASN